MSQLKRITDVLRRHVHTNALTDTNSLKHVLRDIISFSEEIALSEKPRFDATLQLRALQNGNSIGNYSTDISVWTAVLPWETARGLSCVPASAFACGERDPERGMLFADPSYGRGGGLSFWSGAITTSIDVAFLRCVDPHRTLKAELESIIKAPLANRMLDVHYELLDFAWLDPLPADGPSGELPAGDWNEKSFTAETVADRVEMVLETRRFLFADAAKAVETDALGGGGTMNLEVKLLLSDDLCNDLAEKYQICQTFVKTLDARIVQLLQGMNNCASPQQDSPKRATRRSCLSREVNGGPDDDGAIAAASKSPEFAKRLGNQQQCDDLPRRSSRFVGGDPQMRALPTMDYELLAIGWRLGLAQTEAMRHFNRMTHELQQGKVSAGDLAALAALARDPSVCFPRDARRVILAASPPGQ
jgi:hypothetical protein